MAVKLRITSNAYQVAGKMRRTQKNIVRASIQANKEIADFIVDRARFYAPVKSGALRESIRKYRVGKFQFTVSANAPYAIFQEEGTNPSKEFGFFRKRGAGKYGEGYNIPVGSRFGNYPSHPHPGVRAIKFMQRAGADGRRFARQKLTEKVSIAIRKEFKT